MPNENNNQEIFNNNYINTNTQFDNIVVNINNQTNEDNHNNNKTNKTLIPYIVISIIVSILSFTLSINKEPILLLILPIYIILFSIIDSCIHKKGSNFSLAILIGNIIATILCFVLTLLFKEKEDIYMHYAICYGTTSIIGYIITSIINWIISDFKNIKPAQFIGLLIVSGGLGYGVFYVYNKYPDKINKLLFYKKVEVVATTEKDYIIKTLNNRYNTNFICDTDINKEVDKLSIRTLQKISNFQDKNKRRAKSRYCLSDNNELVIVNSIEYNPNKVQYIIQDNYVDKAILDLVKESLSLALQAVSRTNTVQISLYPKEGCLFVGDCIECDEYYSNYEKEYNIDNQYNYSYKLDLTKKISLSGVDFVNDYQFKIRINYIGNYSNSSKDLLNNIVHNSLNKLNELGYKNNYGFEINFMDSSLMNKTVYKVQGNSNNNLLFEETDIISK